MYKFPKNTKILCFVLMLIGIMSLVYGFIQSNQNQYTDFEIREEVQKIYYEYKSTEESYSDDYVNSKKNTDHKDIHKDSSHKVKHGSDYEKHDYHYADI